MVQEQAMNVLNQASKGEEARRATIEALENRVRDMVRSAQSLPGRALCESSLPALFRSVS